MIDRKALLADLRGEVTRLEAYLREQVEAVDGLKVRMQAEHAAATKARRTAATWTSWRDEQVTRPRSRGCSARSSCAGPRTTS